jgi:hypothetical protein
VTPDDACRDDWRDRRLIPTADALHDSATVNDVPHDRLVAKFAQNELLDIYMLCG